MKNKNKIIVIIVIVALLIVAGVSIAFKSQIFSDQPGNSDSMKIDTPRSVALDFFNQWLSDLKSTSTTPYESGLLDSEVLSGEIRAQIERAHANKKEGDVDPVLCLPRNPNKIVAEKIFSTDNKAVFVISPRDKRITTEHQAIVGLTLVENKWLITKLDCTIGEMMVPKEFNFEKVGVLLKQSIQPPYNSENWHLVYEQETEPGFVTPLTFNSESICIHVDGSEYSCDQSKLTETTKVFIQANMTETGAIVKRMTFQ